MRYPFYIIPVVAVLAFSGCSTVCTDRPPIRAIDHACLPAAGGSPADVALFSQDIDAQYIEVATIDSFASHCDDDPQITRQMLEDLKAKARVAGVDAVIRVRKLANERRGFIDNPRTPFPSLQQGKWKESFFRGTGIKYLSPPVEEPAPRPIPDVVTPVDVAVEPPVQQRQPGGLPVPPQSVPQPVQPAEPLVP